jgi:hypothetical protein
VDVDDVEPAVAAEAEPERLHPFEFAALSVGGFSNVARKPSNGARTASDSVALGVCVPKKAVALGGRSRGRLSSRGTRASGGISARRRSARRTLVVPG